MDKVFKNLSWNLVGKITRILLNVVILAKVVDFIGYEKFGTVTLILTYQSYFSIISTLGAEVNYGKQFIKMTYSNMLSTIIFIKISITISSIIFLYCLGVDQLILLSIAAGGLATLNLVDIQLSAKHQHKEFIKISIISSIASFVIKLGTIEFFRNEMLLVYYLIFENLFISIYYICTSNMKIRLKFDTAYAKNVIINSVQFISQRLLYIMSTTLLLILFKNKIDPYNFGQVALSFKIVGFCYIIFAAMTSSFEKLIFGKTQKLRGFCLMYQATISVYLGLILFFPIAIYLSELTNYTSESIYLTIDNYFAIVVSLPYFFMVSVNKWYILNKKYWILLSSNFAIIGTTVLATLIVSDASKNDFWAIWSTCFLIGLLLGVGMDNNRNRHIKILRRSLWPVWKF